MFKSFNELAELVKTNLKKNSPAPLIVTAPYDEEDLKAVANAKELGLVQPELIGNKAKILESSKKANISISDLPIVDLDKDEEIALASVQQAKKGGERSILLKGQISTPVLLKKVLDREQGLRKEGLMGDLFFYENPFKDQERQILAMTDGGVNINPDLEQKKQLLQSAINIYRLFGQKTPHCAILSANEKPSDKIISTQHALQLVEIANNNEFGNCVVEGPRAFDNTVLKWCAEQKGIKSQIAGNVDIMLMPNIEACNLVAKAIMLYLGAKNGHFLFGATIPILINSRIENAESRLHSILLASYYGFCQKSEQPHAL